MYSQVIDAMRRAYLECEQLGVAADVFPKGGIGEFLLAHHLNQRLAAGGQGADGVDPLTGNQFEYKVSAGKTFNFHFGARKSLDENDSLIRRKFESLAGAFLARHEKGVIRRVAFCDRERLLDDILSATRGATGGQLQKGYTFQQFLEMGELVQSTPDPSHPYTAAVTHFRDMFRAAGEVGLADKTFSKGGQGEILLAATLGHELAGGGAGADARDANGGLHEYKVSITNQFNFHLGARKAEAENSALIERKFGHLQGVWVAKRVGVEIADCASCTGPEMARYLTLHFARTKGGQLNKNFSLDEFRQAFSGAAGGRPVSGI